MASLAASSRGDGCTTGRITAILASLLVLLTGPMLASSYSFRPSFVSTPYRPRVYTSFWQGSSSATTHSTSAVVGRRRRIIPMMSTEEHGGERASVGPPTHLTTGTTDGDKTLEDVSKDLRSALSTFDHRMSSEAETVADAERLRVEYLGKKGIVSKAMRFMRVLPAEEKPKLGQVVNEIKAKMEERVVERKEELEMQDMERRMEDERIDVTMPGLRPTPSIGRRHPLSMTMEKAVDIFVKLGYDTVTDPEDSPEIETDYYCFEALNCPKDHPARDMQDTFYLTENMEMMLRTHTSSVQIRQMEKRKPPFRIVAPGRVYRRDDIDATHSMIFHQVEILAIEEIGNLHLGHLKGTVEHFLKNMFGPDIDVRYRGSYFPFTEPSMEVDVFFKGKWLEVLGCGMVDPNVLEMAGVDPKKYGGFAAGFGVERFAMVIHGIDDIREFYNSDARFLSQFPHFHDEGMYAFLRGEDFGKDRDPRMACKSELEVLQMELPEDGGLSILEEEDEEKKAEKKKKEKKKKAKKKPAAAAGGGEIDISKLDIRVGVITKAWVHEEADKLFCEEIDIGEEGGPRQIASGLRAHYGVGDLVGQRVLVLANLKARKLAGFASHGMVLCAVNEDGSTVKFVEPPADTKVGERVVVDGYDGEPATENQVIKKKMLDKIFPDLRTDGDGVATYKGKPLSTSAGACVAQGEMKNAQVS